MRKSPGRIARPLCLLLALGCCVATVIALVIGGTKRGEQGAIGLQMAITLAMLAVMWALLGIMFTLARPGEPERERDLMAMAARHSAPTDSKRVNWFQDATAGTSSRR
jgi:hypothetical protein